MTPDPDRGRVARLLSRILRAVVPKSVADAVLRDIEDGYRRRRAAGARGCRRWLLRQLLLALRPGRVLELRGLGRQIVLERDVGLAARLRQSIGGLGGDVRYALRLLVSSPGFTALTVALLAGGLAVSIFTFSFLYTVMYGPLPIPGGESVVRVMGIRDGRMSLLDAVDYQRLADELDSFAVLGAYETRYVLIRGEEESRPLYGTFIDPNMFDVAPVRPLLGRRLLPEDAAPGAGPVAVLGHGLWVSSFGADPEVVGRAVRINDVSTRIVGVMPEGFGFPVWGEIWLPQALPRLLPDERGRVLSVYGKLLPGVSFARADAELHQAMRRLRADVVDPDVRSELPDTARVRTFQKTQLGDEADLVFFTLHMAAAFILLLACVNAGNLVLSRCLERGREVMIRVALGAPRFRLITQMMAEGAILALVAGALGLWLASEALTLFDAGARAALPEGLAYWWRWGLSGPSLLAAAVLIGLTAALVGGVPAWQVTRADTDAALRDGSQAGEGLRSGRLSRGLVVAQVALIAVLLFLGAMTAVIAVRAADFDRGLDTEGVLVANLDLSDAAADGAARVELVDRLRNRLQASPAVAGVLMRTTVGSDVRPLAVEGRTYATEEQQPRARLRANLGDPGVIGIDLVAGRGFDGRDVAGAEPVAVISETLARELWGGRSPLGERIRVGSVVPAGGADEEPGPWRLVVGVASDILEGNPVGRDRHARTLWVPLAQLAPAGVAVTFRHRGDPRAAITAFHDALAEVAPGTIPERVLDFDDVLATMERMFRAGVNVLGGCFAFALLLALGGIYGLTARAVTRRRREVGIRRALGATDRRIVALFLASGSRQLAVGLGIATLVAGTLSLAAGRVLDLEATLFVAAGLAVAGTISALVLAATYVPTRRAVRVDPRRAIWQE